MSASPTSTFDPQDGFAGDPTPVSFTALDDTGRVIIGRAAVRYAQPVLPPPPPLAATGFDLTPMLGLGGTLVLLGGGLLVLARRRPT